MKEEAPKLEYIYMFGYEDVDEDKVNRETGSDFESEGFFKIRAESPEAALKWGIVLSDWYVAKVFGDDQPGRWSRGEYASWIEEHPRPELLDVLGATPAVDCGEYPDLSTIRRLLHD